MKCPTCGDTAKQQPIGSLDGEPAGYRCAACGRLYRVPSDNLDDIKAHLAEMRAKADELLQRREKLLARIGETEAQLKVARDA